MTIDNTSLMTEVEAIINGRSPRAFRQPRAELTAGGENVPIIKLMALEIRRAYGTAHGDTVFVDIVLPSGAFHHRVYPHRNNLQITLFMDPVRTAASFRDEDVEIETQTFTAVLHDIESEVVSGNDMQASSEIAMDLSDVRQYRLELVDQAAMQLSMMTLGTVVLETSPMETLRAMISYVIQDVRVDDEQAIAGVEIVEPDNTQPYRQLVIPHGTPVVDLADMIQNTAGLYGTGVGSYIQRKTWYVFPLYDHTRFDRADKTLTLINVPSRRFSGVDRTYRETADQIIALVTGQVQNQDTSDVTLYNEGNGVRFSDPDRVFKAFGIAEENKTTALRDEVVNELVTVPAIGGVNYAPMADEKMSSNRYRVLSTMAVRNGSFVMCHWEHSKPDAIYPGMPMKFMYEARGQVFEARGTVLEANHYYMSNVPGVTPSGFTTHSVLLLFIEKALNWNDITGDTTS